MSMLPTRLLLSQPPYVSDRACVARRLIGDFKMNFESFFKNQRGTQKAHLNNFLSSKRFTRSGIHLCCQRW
jgi:hypothetical protein